MKNGIPQPLSCFGFFYDSTTIPALIYPVLSNLEQIATFEDHIKLGIKEGTIQPREAYHFNVPKSCVDKVVSGIYQRDSSQNGKNGGFFGPILESHERFVKLLKDKGDI